MPKALERKLKAEAAAKGYTGERADAYTYGTLNSLGMMKGNKITPKGAAAEKNGSGTHPKRHLNLGKYLHPKRSR